LFFWRIGLKIGSETMFLIKKNKRLARFFQVEEIQLRVNFAISKKSFYYSKLIICTIVGFAFISNFSGSLIAEELSATHLEEVERVFTLDHETDATSLAMVSWTLKSDAKINKVIAKTIDSSEFKKNQFSLDTNEFILEPISYSVIRQMELYNLEKLSCSDSSTFSKIDYLEPSYSLHVYRNFNPSSSKLSITMESYKMEFSSNSTLLGSLLQEGINRKFNQIEILNQPSRIQLTILNELSLKFIYRKWLRTFGYESINLPLASASRMTSGFVGRAHDFMKTNVIGQKNNMTRKDLDIWISIHTPNLDEKHIVINLIRKILSLWHPNQNELHLVNYSTLCDGYQSKSTITKFVKDLKLSS
jgi:hypothetical protein